MKSELTRIIRQALQEDRAFHDITSSALIPSKKISKACIIVKENSVLCGLEVAKQIFQTLDRRIKAKTSFRDGQRVKALTKILYLEGRTRALLSAERVALNFLGHLSGIATLTSQFATKVKSTKAKILDTRKTIPGVRSLERYAVRCGGGINHRLNLQDMIFIKDNHLLAIGKGASLQRIVKQARKKTHKAIELEVENLKQLREALKAQPDIILLDNMTATEIKKAVTLRHRPPSHRKILLEASGGITLKNVSSIARTGVDRISIGALTHSAPNIDFSMEIQ